MTYEAQITAHFPLTNGHWLIRLHCPTLTPHLLPGHALTLADQTLDIGWIKRASGEVELYYPHRTPQLAHLREGKTLSLTPPLGHPMPPPQPATLVADAASFNMANAWLAECAHQGMLKVLALFEATHFPFRPQPSRFLVPGLPPDVVAAHPLCEAWGIPSRLASACGAPGCFDGSLEELQTLPSASALRTILARDFLR